MLTGESGASPGDGLVAEIDASARTEALTPFHAAPEVLEGQAPAPASDVYSLGSTAELLTALQGLQRGLGLPVTDVPGGPVGVRYCFKVGALTEISSAGPVFAWSNVACATA